MELPYEYNAPQFVDFNSINNAQDDEDALAEKYFEIDHENKFLSETPQTQVDFETDVKSSMPMSHVPEIILTACSDDENEKMEESAFEKVPKSKSRINNIIVSWASNKMPSKRILSISKKMSKDALDKRALSKTMAKSIENRGSAQEKPLTSSSRRSSGGRVSLISTKVVKYSRRSSSGTAGNQKETSSNLGNCIKRALKKSTEKASSTSSKPLKASATSSFKLNKMIQSYQDTKLSKQRTLPKNYKMNRASEVHFRHSSIGAKESESMSSSSIYVPMAERIMKMENKTPDRYRTLPNRGRSQSSHPPQLPRSRSNSSVPRITTCKPPKLLTEEKSRPCCHTRSSHEALASPSLKSKKSTRKVCSSESVDRVKPECGNSHKPRGTTKIIPFSFDQKIAEAEAKKASKIKEIMEMEKAKREFRATSAPNFHKPINLPIKEYICPTNAEPFTLDIDTRMEARVKKREESIKLEEKKLKEMANQFRARPAKTDKTFIPLPSNKPPVEVMEFELHSDRRAIEREAFEMRKREKELEMQEQEQRILEKKRHEEMEEVRRLRQKTIVKSNPVPSYPPLRIQPSTKLATISKSPKLSTKIRSLSSKEE